MTKREYIQDNKPVAYISAMCGLEIYGFEYGINDYIYCTSNSWYNITHKKYHKCKIKYNDNGAYFTLYGTRLYLSDSIRI